MRTRISRKRNTEGDAVKVLPDKKYTVLVGHYGSGKTELALALTKRLHDRQHGRKPPLWIWISSTHIFAARNMQQLLLNAAGIDVDQRLRLRILRWMFPRSVRRRAYGV